MIGYRVQLFLYSMLALLPTIALAGGTTDCCGEPLNYHFTLSRVSDTVVPNANSPQTTADFPDLGPNCLGDQLSHQVGVVAAGNEATADVYLNVISEDLDRLFPDPADAELRGRGIQGWAAGIAIDAVEFADVNGDTVADGFISADTAVDVNPLWGGTGFAGGSGPSPTKPFPSYFFFWEFVDPAVNGGQVGSVVGFVHCLDGCTAMEFGELPLEGAESLIRLVVSSGTAGVPQSGILGAVRIQQGLRVSAQSIPADSVFTISSQGFAACNRDDVRMALSFVIDCNTNGVADSLDIEVASSQDCNSNGIPDECDISSGSSSDANANGVPDECDPDCNSNQLPDDLDIAAGMSQDCNANGLPDECDVSSGASEDCNNNGVPDVCDLAAGASQDCNINSTPDECDVASGSSDDVDMNGVPDECIVAGIVPGDWNGDGRFNLADGVRLLNNLFLSEGPELPCTGDVTSPGNQASLDFNGDNRVNLADAISALNRLFLAGDPHVLGDESQCVFVSGCPDVCSL